MFRSVVPHAQTDGMRAWKALREVLSETVQFGIRTVVGVRCDGAKNVGLEESMTTRTIALGRVNVDI